jgi:hypothetical protein
MHPRAERAEQHRSTVRRSGWLASAGGAYLAMTGRSPQPTASPAAASDAATTQFI